MNRVDATFNQLKQRHKKALIAYITAGDPKRELTVPLMHQMVKAGADIIELGIPFSDPVADGPVIQEGVGRALAQGINLKDIFAMVNAFRREDNTTPIILMGYLNPIEIMGYQEFAKRASEANVDGVITVDLPPHEANELVEVFKQYELAPIFLVSPNTSDDRLKLICQYSRAYLYYVSLKGVTGASNLPFAEVEQKVKHIREFSQLPICVGFGIRDQQSAKKIAAMADGVIVGTAIVEIIAKYQHTTDELLNHIHSFVSSISDHTHA